MSDKEETGSSSEPIKEKEPTNLDSGGSGERKPETNVNGEGSSGSTSLENSQPMSVEFANAGSSCGTEANIEQNCCESSAETIPVSSNPLHDMMFKRRRRYIKRQYRRRGEDVEDSDTELDSSSTDPEDTSTTSSDTSGSPNTHTTGTAMRTSSFQISDYYTPSALLKAKPRHKWFAVKEIVNRELGCGGRWQGSERFQHRYYGSLHAVQRLELMYKLDKHSGCVNSLNFNRSGEMLLSASDDKRVVLWDWAADRSILSYDSGHTSNVFQAKFLPLSGDRHIVTCSCDGQVRLSMLSGVGVCKGTRLIAEHKRTVHKLATHIDSPHVFLSAGEDALVLSHDVRASKSTKLLFLKEKDQTIALYSIHSNPVCSNEFIVTGEDKFIWMFDKRKISPKDPVKKFCPQRLMKQDAFFHVTCAVYNHNGTEIVGSYNDDDIYLFDTSLPSESDYIFQYTGHRNNITVKGVNFFGPRSEFIVSGSDCGNIYFWEKSTEAIVQWMRGDEEGVVNCLEPHPQVPIIATSGLDCDVKIWIPSCEQEPTMEGLKKVVVENKLNKDQNRQTRSDPFDNQQMRWLWRQIQHFEHRRNAANSAFAEDGDPEEIDHNTELVSATSSSSEDDDDSGRPQCAPS